ncbi:MAG: L-threonylcarbamoyladenylate synthase [Pseudomonadota bacterium]
MTSIVPINQATISEAVDVLKNGGLVGLPTETVYGLAADATDGEAVAGIFAVKNRPTFNPLISHVTGPGMARNHVRFSPLAEIFAEAFWPGPLTLVLPRRESSTIHPLATAGLSTLAMRAPAHSAARQVLHALGRPLAAPSANPSGKLSPTRAQHVLDGLGDAVSLILDGGACSIGLESTVVEVRGERPYLLREGAITREDLEEVCGQALQDAGEEIRAPGQLLAHYAPDAPVRLNVEKARPEEFMIGFGPIDGDTTLSGSGSLQEAAKNLFATLAEANARHATAIAVAPIPEKGLGRAINDRLRRAAVGSAAAPD